MSYMLLLIGGHYVDARVAFVKLDLADYDWAKQYRWSIHNGLRMHYAKRALNRNRRVYMHRELLGLGATDRELVDHRNGDGLDNRQANLRIVTQSQNMTNVRARGGKYSNHRGVTYDKRALSKRWVAKVKLERRSYFLGRYATEEEAAAASAAFREEHMPYAAR